MQAMLVSQVQKNLGGNVKLIFTGAAPLSPNILQFLRQASGAHILEGYGQTECCGLSTCHTPDDPSIGHVGVPAACNMIKLVDVSDMQYFAKDNVGEICIKGPNVFKGYYQDDEKTKESLDNDGWLHTGDIGKWTEVRKAKRSPSMIARCVNMRLDRPLADHRSQETHVQTISGRSRRK
jgi:long-chain acyl-CoA synthetase